MSRTHYLVRGNQAIELAHVHHGPKGPSVVYNTEVVKINQSLDNLFLRLCELTAKGWEITGDYNHPNGFSAIEFYNEFKTYHADIELAFEAYGYRCAKYSLYDTKPIVAPDGTLWNNLHGVI